MRQTRALSVRAAWAFAAATGLFGLWVGSGAGGGALVRYVDDLGTIAAAALATALCARAAARLPRPDGSFWWLLAAACGSWTLGEAAWAAYDLPGGSVPAVSFADLPYLAALLPLVGALLVHPARRGRSIGKTTSVVDGLVLAVSVFFVAWVFVLDPLRSSTGAGSLGDVVTLAYPLGDVVVVFLAVLVIRGTTDADRIDLWCLLGGVLLITLSDSVYSYLSNTRHFSTGNVVDTGWFAGYLAIGLGALHARHLQAPARAGEQFALRTTAVAVPFLPMLGALLVLAVDIKLGTKLDGTTIAVAVALVALVLARQALLLADALGAKHRSARTLADRLVAALGEAAPPGRRR